MKSGETYESDLGELIATVTEEALTVMDDEEQARYVIAWAMLRDLLGDGPEWLRKLKASH